MNDQTPLLDVRPSPAFAELHRSGAVNIPLEELARRIHELPPRDAPVRIYDDDATRARWAASRLRARDRTVAEIVYGREWLEAGPTQTGTSQHRLWRPHRLLEEAVNHARRLWGELSGRRALDIACGSGRDAVHLAICGMIVEAWDVLPDALDMCRDLAARNGVSMATRRRDVEANPDLGTETWDMVTCFNFLHRPLLPRIAEGVRTGGLVVYETFVEPQRALFGKPSRPAHVLHPRELAAEFAEWETIVFREGLAGPRRYAASLIARKP